MMLSSFQSTRPLRGATRDGHKGRSGAAISIHAPLTGRDEPPVIMVMTAEKFQSTRPLRGATVCGLAAHTSQRFHSTRPLRGATAQACLDGKSQRISIHAPLTGRDPAETRWPPERRYFNPRAPYGARRPSTVRVAVPSEFQSTRPLRGATNPRTAFSPCQGFQSTRPLRGATMFASGCGLFRKFQSTRPLRGATIFLHFWKQAP